MIETNKIYNQDCLIGLRELPSESIDMVLTSPPYDNLRTYNGYSFDFENIAKELVRVIKQGGVIVWVVGDQTKEGSETGTSFRQALYFKELGLNIHDTMIWHKVNPIPLNHNRYEQAFEYMFVFSKGKPKTFNPLLEPTLTSGSYTHRRNTGRVTEAATRNRCETTEVKKTKYKQNIFDYYVGSKSGETETHPAPFPEQLAHDHIVSWSNKGDIVLDPFIGSGTTAKMCIKTDRKYIGFEISKEYCEIVKRRIADVCYQIDIFDFKGE